MIDFDRLCVALITEDTNLHKNSVQEMELSREKILRLVRFSNVKTSV